MYKYNMLYLSLVYRRLYRLLFIIPLYMSCFFIQLVRGDDDDDDDAVGGSTYCGPCSLAPAAHQQKVPWMCRLQWKQPLKQCISHYIPLM